MSKAEEIRSILTKAMSFPVHGCLNSYEACRICNGFPKRDFRPCFVQRRNSKDRCNRTLRGCRYNSRQVYAIMMEMPQLQSEKLRFWDGGRDGSCRVTDLFRFFFMDRQCFEKRILRQTLIPYIGGFKA